jgi:hypothetical protein
MLALFWAEISYQARGLDTDGLRSGFYTINAVIYALQVRQVHCNSVLLVKFVQLS